MSSIVLELQKESISKGTPLTDLLRKAFIVAKKLKIPEFEIWIKRELDGYGDTPVKQYPKYRIIQGTPKVFNPYHGWQPIMFADSEQALLLSQQPCRQSISEIEHLLAGANNDRFFESPYSAETCTQIMEAIGMDLRSSLHVAPSSMNHIVDSVRNIVLQWALRLEEDGILGEGISFSETEVLKAHNAIYSINYFYGDVSNSQIQQGTKSSKQSQENHD